MMKMVPEGNLYESLKANNARYQHSCRSTYSDYNYNCAKRKGEKQCDISTEIPSTSHPEVKVTE